MNVVEYVIQWREKGVNKAVGNSSKAIDRLDKKVNNLNSGINGLTTGFRSLAAAAGAFVVGKEIISTLSEFEKYDAVLTNTFQSQEKASKSLSDLNKFAANTPFQINNLTGAYVKLVNQGFTPTIKQMTKLGDLASSTGKGFDQLAEAVLDAQVGEFERLKEFGIKAKKEGKNVSFSFKGVSKTVKNSEQAIRAYLLSLGDVTGVSGSMAAISKTVGGQISNLQDRVTQLFLSLGQKLKPVIEAVIRIFNSGLVVIQNIANWIETSMLGFDGLAVVIGVLATAISAWIVVQKIINVLLFANPVGLVIAAIAALVAGIVILYKRSETFRGIISGVFNVLKLIYNIVWNQLKKAFDVIRDTFKGTGGDLKKYLMIPINFVIDAFNRFLDLLEKIPGVGKLVKGLRDAFKEGFKEGVEDFRKEQEKAKLDTEVGITGGIAGSGGLSGATGLGGAKGGAPKTAEVRSAAPKQFNINVDKLGNFEKISINNVQEGVNDIEEKLKRALQNVVADIQVSY